MQEYMKIKNVFQFDEKFLSILGYAEPFRTLKDIRWQGTEKVDGTNVRVYWDGHSIQVAGRTDRAQFQGELKSYLDSVFARPEEEYVFEQKFGDKEAYLFFEGYGPKIQTGGGLYSDTPHIIMFDATIDGYELNREKVNVLADELGFDHVPVVFTGTLDEARIFVAAHQNSTLGGGRHEMEGLVLTPADIDIYARDGHRIKCKMKYRDMLRGGIAKD